MTISAAGLVSRMFPVIGVVALGCASAGLPAPSDIVRLYSPPGPRYDFRPVREFAAACERLDALACIRAALLNKYDRGLLGDVKFTTDLTPEEEIRRQRYEENTRRIKEELDRCVEIHYARAVQILLPRCGSDAIACATLGWMAAEGEGLPVSPKHAMQYLRRACSLGNAWSCRRYTELQAGRP